MLKVVALRKLIYREPSSISLGSGDENSVFDCGLSNQGKMAGCCELLIGPRNIMTMAITLKGYFPVGSMFERIKG